MSSLVVNPSVFVEKGFDSSTNVFLGTASPLVVNVPIGTAGWSAGTGLSIGGNTNVKHRGFLKGVDRLAALPDPLIESPALRIV